MASLQGWGISALSLPKRAGPLERWTSWRYLQEDPRSAVLDLSRFSLSSPLSQAYKERQFPS